MINRVKFVLYFRNNMGSIHAPLVIFVSRKRYTIWNINKRKFEKHLTTAGKYVYQIELNENFIAINSPNRIYYFT